MDKPIFAACSAWQGIVEPGQYGRVVTQTGLDVRLLDHGFAASVMAQADDPLCGAYALGQRQRKGDCLVLPIAPGNLFVEGPARPDPATLVQWFGDDARVVDQTGSRASLHLSGAHLQDVLSKGLMIDCDPLCFPAGSGCVTMLGFLSVQVSVDQQGGFEISCMRSMAGDLWHWVATTAGPYGIRVSR